MEYTLTLNNIDRSVVGAVLEGEDDRYEFKVSRAEDAIDRIEGYFTERGLKIVRRTMNPFTISWENERAVIPPLSFRYTVEECADPQEDLLRRFFELSQAEQLMFVARIANAVVNKG